MNKIIPYIKKRLPLISLEFFGNEVYVIIYLHLKWNSSECFLRQKAISNSATTEWGNRPEEL